MEDKERIIEDLKCALDGIRWVYDCPENNAVKEDMQAAYAELTAGTCTEYKVEGKIVDCAESHIYITHLASGRRYHISVIIPTIVYVDVYRILDDGTEEKAFLPHKNENSGPSVSVAAISDTHGYLPDMPAADLAVICGDIFPGEMDKEPEQQGRWFRETFLPWVGQMDCERVILIAGNHDHWIEANNEQLLKEFAPEAGKKLVYLCDSGFEYKGLSIYGTPWVPIPFKNKAFSLKDDETLAEKYSHIPEKLDLLLTHTVPYGCCGIGYSGRDSADLGSKELRKAVEQRNIKYLIGCHIHEVKLRAVRMDFGLCSIPEILNVACCDNHKQPVHNPLIVRIPQIK
mgnify:FL=1